MGQEIVQRLNELLEAERAGVEVCAALAEAVPELKPELDHLKKDEAWSYAGLHRRIVALGGAPSQKKGDFAQKVMALKGLVERLQLLSRGQRWVMKRIDALLEGWLDQETRTFLEEMQEIHRVNVDWCDQRAEALKAASNSKG